MESGRHGYGVVPVRAFRQTMLRLVRVGWNSTVMNIAARDAVGDDMLKDAAGSQPFI